VTTFLTEYFGQFAEPDPAEALADAYHQETERYDRTLPGDWSPRDPECWLPYPHMMKFSRKHAAEVLGRVLADAAAQDISGERVLRAIQDWRGTIPRRFYD
jgi:hypothetical protein